MTFEQLLTALREVDWRHAIEADHVYICAPKDAHGGDLLRAIRLHADELRSLISDIREVWGAAYRIEKVYTGWAADLGDLEAQGFDMASHREELEDCESMGAELRDLVARARELERRSGVPPITWLSGRWAWHEREMEFPAEDADGPRGVRVVFAI